MGRENRAVLRVNTPDPGPKHEAPAGHAHQFVARPHLTRMDGTRYHRASTLDHKDAVDCNPKALLSGRFA